MSEDVFVEDAGRKEDFSPKGFVIAFVCALGTLLTVDLVFRQSLLSERIELNDVLRAKRVAYVKKPHTDIVVLGSSRTLHGVNPRVVEATLRERGVEAQVFNFGVPSGDVPAYLMITGFLLEQPPSRRPGLVVFGLSAAEWWYKPGPYPETAVPSLNRWAAAVRPRDAWPLFTAANHSEEAFTDLTLGAFRLYATRSYVLSRVFDEYVVGAPVDAGQDGWLSFGGMTDANTQNVRATGRARGYHELFNPPYTFDDGTNARYLSKAVDRLRAAGVKVAFYETPQARQLDANHTDPESFYPRYAAHIRAYVEAQGSRYVDLNQFPGLTNLDFVDGDHMCESGAAKFSRVLTERVIEPAWQGRLPE